MARAGAVRACTQRTQRACARTQCARARHMCGWLCVQVVLARANLQTAACSKDDLELPILQRDLHIDLVALEGRLDDAVVLLCVSARGQGPASHDGPSASGHWTRRRTRHVKASRWRAGQRTDTTCGRSGAGGCRHAPASSTSTLTRKIRRSKQTCNASKRASETHIVCVNHSPPRFHDTTAR
eukprot:6172242-Pleurochrysis_carterae.AAC.3